MDCMHDLHVDMSRFNQNWYTNELINFLNFFIDVLSLCLFWLLEMFFTLKQIIQSIPRKDVGNSLVTIQQVYTSMIYR